MNAARELREALELAGAYVVRQADGDTAPRAVAHRETPADAAAELERLRARALAAGAVDDGPGAVRWRYGYRTAWSVARAGAVAGAELAPAGTAGTVPLF